MKNLVASLRLIVGDRHVLVNAVDLRPYVTDWRGRYSGVPLCVVFPAATEEVAALVTACCAAGIAIVPQGGNTGLCGGATPIGGEVVVNLTRMHRIHSIDVESNTITVDAGCSLQSVQEAAESVNRLFPLSLAAEGSATIGGNLSTNAGGVQVLCYGNARDLTLGLEVVLADGRIWNGLRGLRKDNTGYDLKHLFIGAEGSLGVITAATLKLFPRPRGFQTAWAAATSLEAALRLLTRLRTAAGESVTAFELISQSALDLVVKRIPSARQPLAAKSEWHVLLELSEYATDLSGLLVGVMDDAMQDSEVFDAVIAATEFQAKALWALRENISEAQRLEGVSIKHDISLPISMIAQFVDRASTVLQARFDGVRIVCFGHAGDGNLHYNLSKPDGLSNRAFVANAGAATRIVHDLVNELGGSISAEHGIGQLKRTELTRYTNDIEMAIMRSIKHALDQGGLMNPGKVL